MKGIRLHPQYHGYALTNPFLVELVQRARDQGLPVAFPLRMVDSRPSSWLDIEQEWTLKNLVPIVQQVPDAKYLVLNVANLGELLLTFGKTKFAFGSHSPILDYLTGLLRIEALSEQEADEKTKDLLRAGNITRFLNL